MFRRKSDAQQPTAPPPTERITSVISDGVSLGGKLGGSGGVRIEGAFDGEIELDGLLVIGATGRVTCQQLKARHIIVAGAMRGDILAEKVEIRATGRVWGDVVTSAMSTEEGAFLRGQIRMEEKLDLGIQNAAPVVSSAPREQADGNAEAHKQTEAQVKGAKKSKGRQPTSKTDSYG